MLTPFTVVQNASNGRRFAVRFLPTGAKYGRTNSLTADAPMVEFYDVKYADDANRFGPLGQFVSRYYVRTLVGHRGALDLDGGVPVWTVDGAAMIDALRFVREASG